MKLYEKNLVDFTDVSAEEIQKGLEDKTIEVKERIKEHHVVPEEEKRAAKTAAEIFEELKAEGVDVCIHNGVYCKFIYNTYEAINPISAIDDWDEYEEVFAKAN